MKFILDYVMSLNCAEIEAVIQKIPQKGIIRKYWQIDEKSLVITYQPDNEHIFDLHLNVSDKNNFICVVESSNNHELQNLKFSQYLNSKASFASINSIKQYNLSRIVDISIKIGKDDYHLVCRMWGSGANIVFTDYEYEILECLQRYPKRGEWVGEQIDLTSLASKKMDYEVRDIFANATDINNAIYKFYTTQIKNELIQRTKNRIMSICESARTVLQNKLETMQQNNTDPNVFLKYGELIKCNAYQIKNFQEKCCVMDYETNTEITIPLKKTFTVEQNMQSYFEKYKKSKEAQTFIEEQRLSLQRRIRQIDKIVESATAEQSLKKLLELLQTTNLLCGKKSAEKNEFNFGRQFILANNTRAFVSKNAKDADQLLKRVARGNDYWFHIRDYAGSHVIVKNDNNKPIDATAKIQAAHLALYYSQLHTDSNLSAISEGDVYFTQIKYLHKPNTNTPGLVFPTQEKNIKVHFEKKIIDQILGGNLD